MSLNEKRSAYRFLAAAIKLSTSLQIATSQESPANAASVNSQASLTRLFSPSKNIFLAGLLDPPKFSSSSRVLFWSICNERAL